MVPPSSHRIPRVRQYSGTSFAAFAFRLRDFHTVSLVFPYHSAKLKHTTYAVLTPKIFLFSVWPLPLSLATTHRISFDFFSSPYLDVSVQAVPLVWLCIHHTMTGYDSSRIAPFGYPRIDAYLRLLVAFRSLLRPSSAPSAKAFPLRSL